MLDLGIVIVNYRTRDLLRECLQSIYESRSDFSFQVCVVDNCSQDGSCIMVGEEFPQVQLVESEVNGGYAYANNLGLRALGFAQTSDEKPSESTPRYALLLNPDTLLLPSALKEMLNFMEAHPEAGVAGPRLVLADGSLDLACRRSFPSPEVSAYRMVGLSKLFPKSKRFGRYNLTYLDPDEVAEVDSVVGAFMLVRAEALRQVGLLDESFFMYGEDLDWAYRIKKAGWKVYYNPQVTVLHYKRAASRHSRKASYEFYRAMHIFYRKHYAATTPFWLHWLVLGGIALRGGLAMLSSRLLLDS
jgi:GT2 family glycosyltransferase